jgi:pSer/pThr/pTyr-binding forkhead associated (FHA) protein
MQQKFEITDPDIIEIKMIKKVLGALEQEKQPVLQVVSGPYAGHKVVIDDTMDEVIIGRDPQAQLIIDDASISRRHAALSQKWGSYVIRDLGSKNGTFLNAEAVTEERRLKDGDELVFGTVRALFKNPRELDFEAISRSINEKQSLQVTDSSPPSEAPTPAPQAEAQTNETMAEIPPLAQPKDEPISDEVPTTPLPKPVSKSPAKPFTLGRFGPMELTLLGLGALVIFIILISMLLLFL